MSAMTLDKLAIGKDAIIQKVECDDTSLRKHILNMGLTPGTEVTLVKTAPMGDPLELRARGYELTLLKSDAAFISVTDVHDMHDAKKTRERIKAVAHPGKHIVQSKQSLYSYFFSPLRKHSC